VATRRKAPKSSMVPFWRDAQFYHHLREPDLIPRESALLVIDMQYVDAHPDFGIGRKLRQLGKFEQAAYYFAQVDKMVPRIRKLQIACRRAGVEVVHVGLGSLTRDGRDISPLHRNKNISYSPDSQDVQFLPQLAPVGDEIVVRKSSSGVFNSTDINQLLRNLGVRNLIVTGVDTCYCVETAVRDAADRGYNVILVTDACATTSSEMQLRTLSVLDDDYCVLRTTAQVLRNLNKAWKKADPRERAK